MTSYDGTETLLSGFQTDPEPKWNDLPPMIEKREYHAAVKLDDHRILVMGGEDGNYCNNDRLLKSTEIYDTQTNKWESWPELNEKRDSHAAAFCNDKVYVLGGSWLDSIECLDLSSEPLQWKTLNVTLSCNRQGCTAAVVGTDIYIMGGHNGSSPVSSVDILDTTTGTIKKGPSMMTARNGCAAGVIDNTIFVVGGHVSLANPLNVIECLSVDTTTKDLGEWHECNATLSTARYFPAVAVVHQCLVLMGGRDMNSIELSTVEVFDTRRNVSWRLPDMNQRRWACAAAVTLNESQVVVVGGRDGDTVHASMETITLSLVTLEYCESCISKLETKLQELGISIPQLEKELEKARKSLNLVGKKKRIISLKYSLQGLRNQQSHLLNEKQQLEKAKKMAAKK